MLPERAHNRGMIGAGVGSFKRNSLTGSWQPRVLADRCPPQEDKGWRTVMARLKVIPASLARAGRRVILKVARGQPISSSGRLTFECGNCDAVVLQNVNLDQVRDCIIECGCGAFNELAEAP